MTIAVSITNSIIDVDCTINRLGEKEHPYAQACASQIIDSAVHLASFCTGILLIPHIDTVTLPDGEVKNVQAILPDLEKLCTAFNLNGMPIELVLSGPIRWVLRDLVGALESDMTTINCARAMDGIRNLIATPGLKEEKAWAEMRSKLRIDRPYLQFISDQSKDHRHARYVPSGDVGFSLLRRSWTIMDRYFQYLKRGGKNPLPESEFPVLDH
jgi:hypothetical protein